jgi:hypothetical protein
MPPNPRAGCLNATGDRYGNGKYGGLADIYPSSAHRARPTRNLRPREHPAAYCGHAEKPTGADQLCWADVDPTPDRQIHHEMYDHEHAVASSWGFRDDPYTCN